MRNESYVRAVLAERARDRDLSMQRASMLRDLSGAEPRHRGPRPWSWVCNLRRPPRAARRAGYPDDLVIVP